MVKKRKHPTLKQQLQNAGPLESARLLGKGVANKFTVKVTQEICSRLSNGELLTHILKDEHMPCILTVFNWRRAHPDFAVEFDNAREAQGEVLADQIIPIADNKKFHKAASFSLNPNNTPSITQKYGATI